MRILSDRELVALKGEEIVCDIEIYQNYFLICFYHAESNAGVYFEGTDFNRRKLRWILQNFQIVTFNGKHFDNPIMFYALLIEQVTETQLYNLGGSLINGGKRSWEVYKYIGWNEVNAVKLNDIDLIELTALKPSLKMCAARIHAPELEDLPYPPETVLTDVQKAHVLEYCWKDCRNTHRLRCELATPIKLREQMTMQYGIDLRSKSDAQVGEEVLRRELWLRHGIQASVPDYQPGYSFVYTPPEYIVFQTDVMKDTFELIKNETFVLGESRKVDLPKSIKKHDIRMGVSKYNLGIGGLHSCEHRVSYRECGEYLLADRDVASYYPAIIRNNRYYQKHIGPAFLDAYGGIVDRRLEAKAAGDKGTADSLKISINGSYGKLGSPHSFLYSPELLIHTTLTGQLCMLMLIERLELSGFTVISANTDGIVTKVKRDKKDVFDSICSQWESDTKFILEETLYKAVYSRDVNNYFAVKTDGSIKTVGAYAPRMVIGKDGKESFVLKKSPNGQVVNEAVIKYFTEGTPVEETIKACTDVRKFIYVKKAKGGVVDVDDNKIGKVVRWYYGRGKFTALYDGVSGNKVGTSDGAVPYMDFDLELPDDICYTTYIMEANRIINYDFSGPKQLGLFDGV